MVIVRLEDRSAGGILGANQKSGFPNPSRITMNPLASPDVQPFRGVMDSLVSLLINKK